MNIKPKLQKAVNDQIQAEFQSAYQYLALSAWFTERNLPGFAHWMKLQWQEETEHAMKLYNFLHDRDGSVVLREISAPPADFESVVSIFETVLKREQAITKKINTLYELALKEKDYPLQIVLQWYINEQVEEESMVGELIDRLKMIGTEGTGIYLMDKELGERSSATQRHTA